MVGNPRTADLRPATPDPTPKNFGQVTDIYGKFSGRVGPAVRKETWVDVKSVQPWDPVSPINKTAADNTSLPRNFYSCADKDDHARIRVSAVESCFVLDLT